MKKTDWRAVLGRWVLIVAMHLAVLLVWQAWIVIGEIEPYIMPTPLDTFETLLHNEDYSWWYNTYITGLSVFGGFWLAVVAGVALAMVFSWSKWLNDAFMPLLVSLNMIPKIALGPIFIVWFSYGLGPNILIAFSICFLPVLITTARGLNEVEPEMLDLVRVLDASRWQIFTKIQLPNALPFLFSGMKVAVVLAVAGAIVGEFIASEEGLGYLMMQVQVSLDTAAMFMAVLLITLIGVVLYAIVIVLERIFVVRDARVE
jgi:NitT/TauT family transport system permease protein